MSDWADVDAFRAQQLAIQRQTRAIEGWRALAEVVGPERDGDAAGMPPLVFRFRVHANDPRVWLMRPCHYAPKKWRSLGKHELKYLSTGVLDALGFKSKQTRLPSGIGYGRAWPQDAEMKALRLVEQVLVKRDEWLSAGAKIQSRMFVFLWEDL